MIGETLRLIVRSFGRVWFVWLALIIVVTGTNIVDIVSPGPPTTPLHFASLTARLLGITWITAAAYRGLVGSDRLWILDGAFWKYVFIQIAIFVSFFGVVIGLQHLLRPVLQLSPMDESAKRSVALVVAALSVLIPVLLTLRISPWLIALVARDRDTGLAALWRGMRGKTLALFGAAVVIVVPLFGAHFALTVIALRANSGKLSIALIDGIVSSVELVVLLTLTAVAYQRAKSAMV